MTARPETTAEDLAAIALALARRFSAGATMWCLAPDWPEHARHVAVEFVHPVIMGKRALPAVAVVDDDPVSCLRVQVRRRRRPARGGPGVERGPDRARAGPDLGADHRVDRVRVPSRARGSRSRGLGRRRRSRRAVRRPPGPAVPPALGAHPRVLRAPGPARRRSTTVRDEVCITCSDEGSVAEVVEGRTAYARGAGSTGYRRPSTRCWWARSSPGDLVLVHAGTAIARVDAVDAVDAGRL